MNVYVRNHNVNIELQTKTAKLRIVNLNHCILNRVAYVKSPDVKLLKMMIFMVVK